MSTTSETINATTIGGPLLGGPHLIGGNLVEPTPALQAYLRALTDVGIAYTRVMDYANLLVFTYVVNTGPDASTRLVVQYPETDDAYALGNDPSVVYGLATFADGSWPEDLSCMVFGGGTLGVWPQAVDEVQRGDAYAHRVYLPANRVDSVSTLDNERRDDEASDDEGGWDHEGQ